MMRFDAETYLPEDVLTKVDRMSMAHSIESRVPLLDNEVMAFASTLPASLKIKDGRRKHILKEVAATLLPREILDRRKQGFGVPLGVWFRGNLRELFADTLLVARQPPARLFPARRSSAVWSTSTSPASAITRCGCGNSSSSNAGISSTSTSTLANHCHLWHSPFHPGPWHSAVEGTARQFFCIRLALRLLRPEACRAPSPSPSS